MILCHALSCYIIICILVFLARGIVKRSLTVFHMVHLIRPETLTITPNQLQLTLSITACGSIQNTTLTICMSMQLSQGCH